jgi:hypothetical protein
MLDEEDTMRHRNKLGEANPVRAAWAALYAFEVVIGVVVIAFWVAVLVWGVML